MKAAERGSMPIAEPPAADARSRLRSVVSFVAGPALIVASVVLVYRGFVFSNLLSSQHEDMLSFSLPNYCFLGQSLKSAHVPLLDPYTMGGIPFAADPQSGWMNLPAMLVFWALPCSAALRFFIVLQPIVAGVGLYWFLRGEALSRAAATVAGLVLALCMVSSTFGLMLAFSAIVAWLPVLLGAASRCLRSRTWPKRLGWCLLLALVWGQLVASFFTTGVLLGAGALLLYGSARTIVEIRARRLRRVQALVLWGVLLLALPAVNMALLLPRLDYLSHSSLAMGYDQMQLIENQHVIDGSLPIEAELSRLPQSAAKPSFGDPGLLPTWILKIITSPGTYLGALPLMLGVAAVAARSLRDRRIIVVALGAFGILAYLMTLNSVTLALAGLFSSTRVSSLLVHDPPRNIYGVFVAVAALTGFGVQGLSDASSSRERILLIVPGLALWVIAPLAFGARPSHLSLAAAAGLAGLALFVVASRRRRFMTFIPLLVAVELCANASIGQNPRSSIDPGILVPKPMFAARAPTVDAAAYLRVGSVVNAIRSTDGRYFGFYPRGVNRRGYLTFGEQAPDTWGLMADQRGILFGLQDVQGYNSLQLPRYWSFVRATTRRLLDYNAAVFPEPSPVVFDLLQVNSVVGRTSPAPVLPVASSRSVVEGPWALYKLDHPVDRASILKSWQVVGSEAQALEAVTAPGFDPATRLILERSPGVTPAAAGANTEGSAAYQTLGAEDARITVTSAQSAVVLVRNVYDPNWRAWVDGNPVPVLAADYVVQGIPVAAGRHSIVLSYLNPSVGRGLASSAAAVILMVGAAAAIALSDRRRSRRPAAMS